MAKTQNTDNTKGWQGCGAIGTHSLLREYKMVQPPWKTDCQHKKINVFLPYDPAIMLLDICPNKLKIYVHTKTCTWMFIAALFIIAETWKQPTCLSVGKWTNTL